MKLRPGQLLVYVVLGLYSLLVALPIIWMFFSSTKTTRELFTTPFALPADPQWSNFALAWTSGISHYLLNSLIVTTTSVILIVLVSALAAYALARIDFPGRIAIYLLLIAGFAIPVYTVLVPLYRSLNAVNLLNTHPGLVAPYMAFGIPFSVLLLYAFFLEFPGEIEDAAHIDGCNTWQMVFQVVMPLSMPALVSVIDLSDRIPVERVLAGTDRHPRRRAAHDSPWPDEVPGPVVDQLDDDAGFVLDGDAAYLVAVYRAAKAVHPQPGRLLQVTVTCANPSLPQGTHEQKRIS